MLNPSDIAVRPTDLTERPAPKGSAGAPALPEPTPTTMAERFAPAAQKLPADGPAPHLVDPALMPRLIAERARASSAGRWLLIAAILVSLVPTAIILALLWQGVIAIPQSGDAQKSGDVQTRADQTRADPEPLAATQASHGRARARRPTCAQVRHCAHGPGPDRGEVGRRGRLHHRHRFGRHPAGAQRHRHSGHA